jgi:hypothetical protein
MALTAGQINPAYYPQPNYSGVVQSAQMQAREMANIGERIGGVIKDFGEAKKEQKKVEASNKASAKAIEAAITLGDSYGVSGAKETLSPFLEAYNDPSRSSIEKAALLEEAKAMIPNVFGRFDQSQAMAIKNAELQAQMAPSAPQLPTPIGSPFFVSDPGGETETQYQKMSDGRIVPIADLITGALDFSLPQDESMGNAVDGIGPIIDMNTPSIDESPTGFDGAPGVLPSRQLGAGQRSTSKKDVEIRSLTREERAQMNLPKGDYVGRFVGGKLAATPTIIPPNSDLVESRRTEALDAPNIALVQKAQDSAQKLPTLQAALNLLNSDAVKTGTFANYVVDAKRFFEQDVANEEQFNSLVGNLAMEAIDLTKGAISDKEMKYFTEVLAPNIGKSKEGNKKIIEFKIEAAKRDIEIAKRVSELFANNASPLEVQAEIFRMMEKKPLSETPAIEQFGISPEAQEAMKTIRGQ